MLTPSLLPRLLPGKSGNLDNDADDEQEGDSVAATEGSTDLDVDAPSEGKTYNQMLLKLLEEGEKVCLFDASFIYTIILCLSVCRS